MLIANFLLGLSAAVVFVHSYIHDHACYRCAVAVVHFILLASIGLLLVFQRRNCTNLGLLHSTLKCDGLANQTVAWDAEARRCVPDVCGGAHLPDLLEVEGRVPAAMLCGMHLRDTAATRACLTNKRIVLLGDSTMLEVGHDIMLLMSGLSKSRTAAREYLRTVGRQPQEQESTKQILLLDDAGRQIGNADLTFYYGHRHMAAEFPPFNFSMVQRFSGKWA